MPDEIICGVNVRLLKEQCERLAEPIRASTRSFQYASALDNCVEVINELQNRVATLTQSPSLNEVGTEVQPRYTTKRMHAEIDKARAYGLELAAEAVVAFKCDTGDYLPRSQIVEAIRSLAGARIHT